MRLKFNARVVMVRTLNLKALSEAIGVDKGQLSKESRRDGFPHDTINGGALFNLEEVRAWRAANVRQRKQRAQIQTGPRTLLDQAEPMNAREQAASPEPEEEEDEPLANENDAFIQTLVSGRATALDVSRAAMQLASRRVAFSAVKAGGKIDMGALDDLKKSLQELRQAETDYIELAERQGQLIDRGVARAIVGACCTRLVQACNNLKYSIATELSLWIADPKIRELPTEERATRVAEYVAGVCDEVRRQAADGADKVIDAALEEEKGVGDAI